MVGFTHRAPVVVADLRVLEGPMSGVHVLPLALDSSAREERDFADRQQRGEAYEVVLHESTSPGQVAEWLDRDELVRLWPQLYLPRVVRAAWEHGHPELAVRGASDVVPSAGNA